MGKKKKGKKKKKKAVEEIKEPSPYEKWSLEEMKEDLQDSDRDDDTAASERQLAVVRTSARKA